MSIRFAAVAVVCSLGVLPLAWSADDRFRAGLQDFDAREFGRAISEFQAAVQAEPANADAHRYLGRSLMEWGDLEQAARELEKAVSLSPKSAQVHCDYGFLLADKLGRIDEGVREFQQSIRLNPALAEAHYNLGAAFFQRGELEQAIASFRRAVEARPNYAGAWRRLGEALAQKEQPEAAVKALARAIELEPDVAKAHYSLSVALRKAGRDAEADKVLGRFEELRKREPGSVDNVQARFVLQQSVRAMQAGRLEEAGTLLHQSLEQHPEHATTRNALGVVLLREGKLADAEKAFRAVLADNPDFAEGHANLGETLLKMKRADEAVAEFRRALALRPRLAKAHFSLGLALAEQQRWPEAAGELRQFLKLDPGNPGAWGAYWSLAQFYGRMGKADQALEALKSCVRLEPGFGNAWLVIGIGLEERGRPAEALEAYRAVLKRNPVHKLGYDALVRLLERQGDVEAAGCERRQFQALTETGAFQQAVDAMASGDFEKAASLFEAVLARTPGLFAAERNLGVCRYAAGKYDLAARHFERLVALDSIDAESHLNLAATFQKLQKPGEALAHASDAIRLNPENAYAYYVRGLALIDKGDREAAMRAFHTARQLNPALRPQGNLSSE